MTLHGVYGFNSRFCLVEMTCDCPPDGIDWFGFSVPEDGKDEYELETPYMEQFLNEDGTEKLCEAWDEPADCEDMTSTRVAFFIAKGHGEILETPFGSVSLSDVTALPKRLKDIIEFEKP